mmetsp:Transcript_13438/g.39119  ORF Transcript_13438/g.39119 Transcript_13438/m.39119 type:complete len:88 (+) Transcript_13438:311-574(+)
MTMPSSSTPAAFRAPMAGGDVFGTAFGSVPSQPGYNARGQSMPGSIPMQQQQQHHNHPPKQAGDQFDFGVFPTSSGTSQQGQRRSMF